MSSDTVRLEGFNSSLKGQRVWLVGPSNRIGNMMLHRLSQVEEEFLGRGRRILLLQNSREIPMRWSQKVQWDATFRIREAQDLRLAATYIQNSIKPLRIVWIGEEPPLSLLSICSSPDICFLGAGANNPRMGWSAIFWDSSSPQNIIEETLSAKMGSPYVASLKLGSVLSELKASQVGFVWSLINESEKTGSVYWCDYEEDRKDSNLTMEPKEAVECLREIASFLDKRF